MTLKKHPVYLKSIFVTKKTPSKIITKTIRYNCTNPQCKTIFFKPQNNYTKSFILPVKLTYLKLNDYYWEPLIFPKTTRYFSSGYTWDQPVVLPSKIKKLILGDSYTQILFLPKSIVHFEIGNSFNEPINLPNKLHIVKFGNLFNQCVVLPKSINYLHFGHSYNLNVVLPPRLKSFVLKHQYMSKQCVLPLTLQVLSTPTYSNNLFVLPENIRVIKINSTLNQTTTGYIDNLPNQTKRLIFTEYFFNTPVVNLPNKINSIDVHYKRFDKKLICQVPSLKTLRTLNGYKESPESRENDWFINACFYDIVRVRECAPIYL